MLLVQGQSDTLFNLNDATRDLSRSCARRHVPVGMIWNSGGHGGYTSQPGECEAYDGIDRTVRTDGPLLPHAALAGLDGPLAARHARRAGPGVHLLPRLEASTAAAAPTTSSTAPSGASRCATLDDVHAVGHRRPGAAAAPDGRAASTFINPPGGEPAAYTETSNFTGPGSDPEVARTSAPRSRASSPPSPRRRSRAGSTSVGIPSARLRITNTNGQDMVFFAKVYDVAPDGGATLIHRLIAPVRVPAGASATRCGSGWPASPTASTPGHGVRLVLCATDQTSYNAKVADVLTVRTGGGSTFTLPGQVSPPS